MLTIDEKKLICDFFEFLFSKFEKSSVEQPPKNEQTIVNNPKDRLIPVSKWNEYHDYPSVSALRSLIFNKDVNGFHVCIRKVGRRVLICEKSFFEYVNLSAEKKDKIILDKRFSKSSKWIGK